jgi:hypothetical protein
MRPTHHEQIRGVEIETHHAPLVELAHESSGREDEVSQTGPHVAWLLTTLAQHLAKGCRATDPVGSIERAPRHPPAPLFDRSHGLGDRYSEALQGPAMAELVPGTSAAQQRFGAESEPPMQEDLDEQIALARDDVFGAQQHLAWIAAEDHAAGVVVEELGEAPPLPAGIADHAGASPRKMARSQWASTDGR